MASLSRSQRLMASEPASSASSAASAASSITSWSPVAAAAAAATRIRTSRSPDARGSAAASVASGGCGHRRPRSRSQDVGDGLLGWHYGSYRHARDQAQDARPDGDTMRLAARPVRPMRFGIFYEHQNPRPWEGERDEHRLLKDALDQIEIADRAGFDYVWEVEHHFLEEYSHSSAPEVFLAAASQRTENIRLGPRHRAAPTRREPPRPRGRAGGHARPGVRRQARLRHRRVVLGGGAGRLPRGPRAQARDVGGRDRRDHPHVRRGAVRRLGVRVHPDAAPQRGAQAAPAAPPAAVGRLQPPRDDPLRRPQRHRRPLVLVRRARGRRLRG